jgi:hypothetical protein
MGNVPPDTLWLSVTAQQGFAADRFQRRLKPGVSPTMAMTPQIQAALRGFNDIILGGVPILLRQNETAFLSFMCSAAAIDALAGYRRENRKRK